MSAGMLVERRMRPPESCASSNRRHWSSPRCLRRFCDRSHPPKPQYGRIERPQEGGRKAEMRSAGRPGINGVGISGASINGAGMNGDSYASRSRRRKRSATRTWSPPTHPSLERHPRRSCLQPCPGVLPGAFSPVKAQYNAGLTPRWIITLCASACNWRLREVAGSTKNCRWSIFNCRFSNADW